MFASRLLFLCFQDTLELLRLECASENDPDSFSHQNLFLPVKVVSPKLLRGGSFDYPAFLSLWLTRLSAMKCSALIADQPFELKVTGPRTNLGSIPVHLRWEGAGIDIPTCNCKHAAVDKPLVIHPLVNTCVAAVKFGQIWGPGRACAVMRTVLCVSSSPTEITHWSLSDLRTPLESVPMVENDLWWVESVQTGDMHWNEWEFDIWEYYWSSRLSRQLFLVLGIRDLHKSFS